MASSAAMTPVVGEAANVGNGKRKAVDVDEGSAAKVTKLDSNMVEFMEQAITCGTCLEARAHLNLPCGHTVCVVCFGGEVTDRHGNEIKFKRKVQACGSCRQQFPKGGKTAKNNVHVDHWRKQICTDSDLCVVCGDGCTVTLCEGLMDYHREACVMAKEACKWCGDRFTKKEIEPKKHKCARVPCAYAEFCDGVGYDHANCGVARAVKKFEARIRNLTARAERAEDDRNAIQVSFEMEQERVHVLEEQNQLLNQQNQVLTNQLGQHVQQLQGQVQQAVNQVQQTMAPPEIDMTVEAIPDSPESNYAPSPDYTPHSPTYPPHYSPHSPADSPDFTPHSPVDPPNDPDYAPSDYYDSDDHE